MEVNVNGVNITLTDDQLKQIDKQVKRRSLSVIERIKSYEDACEEQNIHPEESKPFKNPQTLKQQQANAFWEAMTIADALNGDAPDNKKIWIPYFNTLGGFSFRGSRYDDWCSRTYAGAAARLCVFDEKTSDHFGSSEKFLPMWKLLTTKTK